MTGPFLTVPLVNAIIFSSYVTSKQFLTKMDWFSDL